MQDDLTLPEYVQAVMTACAKQAQSEAAMGKRIQRFVDLAAPLTNRSTRELIEITLQKVAEHIREHWSDHTSVEQAARCVLYTLDRAIEEIASLADHRSATSTPIEPASAAYPIQWVAPPSNRVH